MYQAVIPPRGSYGLILTKMKLGEAVEANSEHEYNGFYQSARNLGLFVIRRKMKNKYLVFKVSKEDFEKHKCRSRG